MALADKQTIVGCGEVYFHQPGQTGELLGNGSKQVSMTLSSGETILADFGSSEQGRTFRAD